MANIAEHDRYGGGSIMVWGGISWDGRTDLVVLGQGTLTGLWYRDEVLDTQSSDDETKKAKPCVRGLRGFGRKKLKSAPTAKDHESVAHGFYSDIVGKTFNKISMHVLTNEMRDALADTDADVEDDLLSKCSKKKDLRTADILISDDDDAENIQNLRNSPSKHVNTDTVKSPSPPPPPSPPHIEHGKKRKTRSTKQKKNLMNAVDQYTKNRSDAQHALYASQHIQTPEPDTCIIDVDECVTVRVTLHGNIQRFNIPSDEPFITIISQIAGSKDVQDKHVMLVHKDKTLRTTDTPLSIKLQMADIIECHITSTFDDSLNDSCEQENPNLIELVVQSQDTKHRELVQTHVNKPLSAVIGDYAKRVKKDPASLQFMFDGEPMILSQTPALLDMEDGDIIDVKEVNAYVLDNSNNSASKIPECGVVHILY